ncbi:hypothetical protein [Niabella hibiscisoli]|uniref:hypothetical protein n=1 Tax=Niabella hibiscisoli TaxID=1825928 RepID=UPI001F0FB558|nr:hypothetical protein [Niabella hibiscisoli]MCH5719508.1 hypothetical protein [Niabella hibiscisoli]
MPSRLLRTDDIALNYISAKKGDTLLLAFLNQSLKPVTSKVRVNPSWVTFSKQASVQLLSPSGKVQSLKDSAFQIVVPAAGMTAVAISGAGIPKGFQDQILATQDDSGNDYAMIPEGDTKALLFKLGAYSRRLYVFMQEDDSKWKSVKLVYQVNGKQKQELVKGEYPFEFTIPVDANKPVRFKLELTGRDGKLVHSQEIELGR